MVEQRSTRIARNTSVSKEHCPKGHPYQDGSFYTDAVDDRIRHCIPCQGEVAIEPARASAIAARGVYTGEDFARLMSGLMSDVIEGRLAPDVANAACRAGDMLLKVVQMKYKYAPPPKSAGDGLMLAPPTDGEPQ